MSLASDIHLPALNLVNVSMGYRGAAGVVPVLHEVTVGFPERAMTAVMGPSGSGKTTLLHCAAGLERPLGGKVLLGDTELAASDERELTTIRRNRIGFVFQQFNLLPILTVYENVALPLRLDGRRVRRPVVMEALRQVGLEDKASRWPAQLSGGQQQRVAIARTLAAEPEIIFADEPTGSLDRSTGRQVMDLLRQTVDKAGRTVVMVTHDPLAAAYMKGRLWPDRVERERGSAALSLAKFVPVALVLIGFTIACGRVALAEGVADAAARDAARTASLASDPANGGRAGSRRHVASRGRCRTQAR